MDHLCHAVDCTRSVPPRMLMCRKHWSMVPDQIRSWVWATYVGGQEQRKDPTPAYIEAARSAIDAVAEAEGKGGEVRA